MSELTDDLLRVLVRVTGRVAIPPDELRELVGSGPKQLGAYNLCDGTRRLAEVVKKMGLDSGNFTRTLQRWERIGIAFRVGDDENPLHLYPLPEE